ncbi:MAG: 16S rRNA (guanine(527)-N(7))-methyltransferase RsmG [Deltaproteobacteria bacterium]|nr:MAG: 16S rRNA (guanine(527)-N(7))-methyltransferase RsmG [Deltaproteobacteria bacterium]
MENAFHITSWQAALEQGLKDLPLDIDASRIAQMALHAELLVQWNRRINLTAIVDPVEMAWKHWVDSLSVLDQVKPDDHVLDMGSGAGFPGLVWKTARPEMQICMVDAVQKKIHFIRQVLRSMGHATGSAVQARIEVLATDPAHRGAYDCVTCRAYSSLSGIIEQARPLLKPGGRIIAMKSMEGDREWSAVVCQSRKSERADGGKAAPTLISRHPYRLTGVGAERLCLVIGFS